MGKVLIVAFDGMDKELIEEYDLTNVVQNEFGGIDNDTDISRRVTSELFVSFITGATWKNHGVEGLNYRFIGNKVLRKFDDLINSSNLDDKTYGIRNALLDSIRKIEFVHRAYMYEDYSQDTIFEEAGGKALFVPGYNPDPAWMVGIPHQVFKHHDVETFKKENHANTEKRLNKFRELNHEFWPLVMLHLHEPDAVQDIGLKNPVDEYRRLDQIAGEIIENYSKYYDTIIFLSDHGLSEEEDHNENAFYSCNQQLFPNKTPHITDFYEKILELCD